MVPVPNIGARTNPPRNAPTMPTMTFRSLPCVSFVPMIMLASQPSKPPTINQAMKPMTALLVATGGSPATKQCKSHAELRGEREIRRGQQEDGAADFGRRLAVGHELFDENECGDRGDPEKVHHADDE